MAADATPIAADQDRQRLDGITHLIIGAAQRVSSTLGHGFLEKVYENSLVVELRESSVQVARQPSVRVEYHSVVVGEYFPDLIVADEIIVEIKAIATRQQAHRRQCVNYLKATGHRVCLLLNFGARRLEVRRVVLNF